MKTLGFPSFLVALLLAAPTAIGQQIDLETVKKAKQATVWVVVKTDLGGGSGSGFFLDKQHVITNHHVISAGGEASIKSIEVVLHSGQPNEKYLKAKVVDSSSIDDLAILRVEGGVAPATLSLGDSDKVMETQTLWVFGFPFGQQVSVSKDKGPEISVSKSNITSLRKNDENILTYVQMDGAINPGNSGGPILNDQGQVCCLVVSGLPGRAINFGIPVNILKSFLHGRLTRVEADPLEFGANGGKMTVTAEVSSFKAKPKQVWAKLVSPNGSEQAIPLTMQGKKYVGSTSIPEAKKLSEPRQFTLSVGGTDGLGTKMSTLSGPITQYPQVERTPQFRIVIVRGKNGKPRIELVPIKGSKNPPKKNPPKKPPSGTQGPTKPPPAGFEVTAANCTVADLAPNITVFTDSSEAMSSYPKWFKSAKIVRTSKSTGKATNIRCSRTFKAYVMIKQGESTSWLGSGYKPIPGTFRVGGDKWVPHVIYVSKKELTIPAMSGGSINYFVFVSPWRSKK